MTDEVSPIRIYLLMEDLTMQLNEIVNGPNAANRES